MRRYVFISHANDDKPRLKPLVETLLDAGVPLWIDRPEEIGLDDRHLNCGRIVAGADWQQEIHLALERANCVLFVLSRASNSGNRSDELYREFEFGISRDMLVMVQIDDIARADLNPFFRLRQVIDLTALLGSPEPSRAARAKFEVLVDRLRDRLMAESRSLESALNSVGFSTPAVNSRESSKQQLINPPMGRGYRSPRLLPYMTNRYEQQWQLSQVVQSQIDGKVNRALTFFVVGSEDECIDSFVEQLRYDRLPRIMESNGMLGQILFKPLQWPAAGEEEVFFQDDVTAKFAEIQSQVYRALGLRAASAAVLIQRTLASAQVSCCFHISMSLDQWGLGQRGLIQHWLQWWASMDLTSVSCPVISIVSVVYPPGLLRRYLSQRAIRRMQADIQMFALDADFGSAVHVLPELRRVRFEDVDNWIREYVDDADREALRRRVSKQFSRTLSLRRRRLSMYETAAVIKAALSDPQVRMETL